jgi:hypothetical protein
MRVLLKAASTYFLVTGGLILMHLVLAVALHLFERRRKSGE